MGESDDDSDYVVEQYIRPKMCSVPLTNDESADLLGNFDDTKRKKIESGGFSYPEVSDLENESEGSEDEPEDSSNDDEIEAENEEADESVSSNNKSFKIKKATNTKAPYDGKISQDQVASLLKGSAKPNRLVLYVTNLNYETSKERLTEHFSSVGTVKTVRIPKNRKGGFAFIEMCDIEGFQNAFSLHNTKLDDRSIKIQLSEAGKKKSANKRNIIKQKNRKLAEMRNETKFFLKSGKYYDKNIKKEIAKEKLEQTKMWERRKARREKRKV